MFNINQIGNAPEAEAFIKTLYDDKDLKRNVYITAGNPHCPGILCAAV